MNEKDLCNLKLQ